ncbi:MAG: hypothetical protein DRJ40_07550 [Thermoprotei archaeon]|nr:MAG: hypothetical protein DRJ40_07550 [Thermoprotei archaeon]
MSEEIPLKPVTRQDIHKLEIALLIATLFRPEVLDLIRDPSERVTWLDSLAVAAAALARHKAGMSTTEIADELGRSEGTIRNHLAGKTKAGKLVLETYEKFVREGVKIPLPEEIVGATAPGEVTRLKEENERLKKENEELKRKVEELTKENEELRKVIQQIKSLVGKA